MWRSVYLKCLGALGGVCLAMGSGATSAAPVNLDVGQTLHGVAASQSLVQTVSSRRGHFRGSHRWNNRHWRAPRRALRSRIIRPRYYYSSPYWVYPPAYYYPAPRRVIRSTCSYWRQRCGQNWGWHGRNFRGCLRYHGCL